MNSTAGLDASCVLAAQKANKDPAEACTLPEDVAPHVQVNMAIWCYNGVADARHHVLIAVTCLVHTACGSGEVSSHSNNISRSLASPHSTDSLLANVFIHVWHPLNASTTHALAHTFLVHISTHSCIYAYTHTWTHIHAYIPGTSILHEQQI